MHSIITGGGCRERVNKSGFLDTSEPLRALKNEAQICSTGVGQVCSNGKLVLKLGVAQRGEKS